MAKTTKISELQIAQDIDGSEYVPLLKAGGNPRVSLNTLKEFFKDSGLAVFDSFDDVAVFPSTVTGEPSEEEGAVIELVYLTRHDTFLYRKIVSDGSPSYYTGYSSQGNYMNGRVPRTDRVFYCITDRGLYSYNGAMKDLFDTVRINVMTEEELENLENPIEGAIYATLE